MKFHSLAEIEEYRRAVWLDEEAKEELDSLIEEWVEYLVGSEGDDC